MRVTNSMLVSSFMNNLNTNLTKLDKLQTQLARNRKYAHMSDDPISVIYSLQSRYKLERLDSYKKGVDMAQSWLTQAETSVMEINEIFKSAYESTMDLSTNVKGPEDLANAAEYIGQLREQLVQTLNTTFGDKYVFSGYNTTGSYPAGTVLETPFKIDETTGHLLYNGFDLTSYQPGADPAADAEYQRLSGENLSFWIGQGLDMEVTVNGVQLVGTGENNLYSLLDDLYKTAVGGGTVDEINDFIPKLQAAQSGLLSTLAEIGGRTSRLDMIAARYETDNLNYTTMKSDAEDADQAEIIMMYKMAEAVYKAALSTGAMIIQPTLMDFLR